MKDRINFTREEESLLADIEEAVRSANGNSILNAKLRKGLASAYSLGVVGGGNGTLKRILKQEKQYNDSHAIARAAVEREYAAQIH
ncbi:hypothetical protein J4463_00285 [Candidatus Pacearchaeota archaeon]|nr:hypothetical protein [Candidatus Pacearchaeota archaeon]